MVVGAMPLARNASRSLDGNTIRSSPVRTVSGWKVRRASRTVSDRSGKPNRSLAVQRSWNTSHLLAVASGGRCLAAIWLAMCASASDRRPKGVVGRTDSMCFDALFKAKKSRSPKRRRLLTAICGSPTFSGAEAEIFVGSSGFRGGHSVPGAFFLRVTPVGD